MQKPTLRDQLLPALRARFPDRQFAVGPDQERIATFPAAHADFGDLVVLDDGDEVTVFVGRLTHTHFGPVKDLAQADDVTSDIAEPLFEFLDDLFADRLLVWCVPRKRAGYRPVDGGTTDIPKDASVFLWSGPWRPPGDGSRLEECCPTKGCS